MATEKRLTDANALYIKLGKLAREPDYQHEGEDWSVGVAMAMGEVWSAPTVDAVEVVHGRWEKIPYHPYRCSKCNEIAPLDQSGEFHYTSNYCPNCGAYMMDGDGNG